jgi:hypothetical protein
MYLKTISSRILIYPAFTLCLCMMSAISMAQDSLAMKAPHGGKLELNGNYYLELVNKNHKLAFYLYDTAIKPVSNKNKKGNLVVKSVNKVLSNFVLKAEGLNGFSPGNTVFNNFSSCTVSLSVQGQSLVYKFKDLRSTMVQYTCQVHPEIVKNEPGQCPKCGMELVEKKELAKIPMDLIDK